MDVVRVTDYHRSYVTKTPSLFLPHIPSSEGKGSLFLRSITLKEGFFSLGFGLSFSCLDTREVFCAFRQFLLESVARNKQAVRSK